MPKPDPNITAHLEWLGFVRPTGLVLSAPALVGAGAILNRRDAEGQRRLQACVEERQVGAEAAAEPCLPDFRAFAQSVLDWRFSPRGYAGTKEAPLPEELEAAAPDSGEILRPDFAVRSGAPPPPRRPRQGGQRGPCGPGSKGRVRLGRNFPLAIAGQRPPPWRGL